MISYELAAQAVKEPGFKMRKKYNYTVEINISHDASIEAENEEEAKELAFEAAKDYGSYEVTWECDPYCDEDIG